MSDRSPIIIDELGLIYGRDAIFLDTVLMHDNQVTLKGELTGSLCQNIQADIDIPYQIVFDHVLHFQATELDFYPHLAEYTASFEEMTYSKLMDNYRQIDNNKFTSSHKHYVFYTYDHIFEVIASGFVLTLSGSGY